MQVSSLMDIALHRRGIPGALAGHVGSGALGAWRLNICYIMEKSFVLLPLFTSSSAWALICSYSFDIYIVYIYIMSQTFVTDLCWPHCGDHSPTSGVGICRLGCWLCCG